VRATERADDLWKQLFSKQTMALSGQVYPVGLLVSPGNARIFDVNIVTLALCKFSNWAAHA
jgi:hypothetical protein